MKEERIFLAKIKNEEDRDVVKYVEFVGFECNHYFGGLHIHGACFCGFEDDLKNIVESDFDKLETILTKDEFIKLFELNNEIKALGYGIKKDSEKYKKGIEILEEYKNTIEKKLLSDDNKKLFEKVIADEKQYITKNYEISESEVDYIFENYDLEYQDRAIIGTIFKNFDEMVEEEKFNFGFDKQPYFDDESFGNDLLKNENYLELESGKIVLYNY